MKASAVSTITKSLPIALSVLVNYSLLATLGYINLFLEKEEIVIDQLLKESLHQAKEGKVKELTDELLSQYFKK